MLNNKCTSLTVFLFMGSLNARSPRSFWGNNFASGRMYDMRLNPFKTGPGGVTSSAILPLQQLGLN